MGAKGILSLISPDLDTIPTCLFCPVEHPVGPLEQFLAGKWRLMVCHRYSRAHPDGHIDKRFR